MVVPLNNPNGTVMQVLCMGRGISYLTNGYVFINRKINNRVYKSYQLNMGNDIGEEFRNVIEFTISSQNSLIVRNDSGMARYIYILNNGDTVYGDIIYGVIRLAGGTMLKTSNSFAVSDNGYVPIGSNGAIDMIPVPQCGASTYSERNEDAPSFEYIGDGNSTLKKKIYFNAAEYSLYTDGTLKLNGTVKLTGVVDFTVLRQTESYGYKSGNFPNRDNPTDWNSYVIEKTKQLLSGKGASVEWIEEYEYFMNNVAEHAACMWAGSGASMSHTTSDLPCISTYLTVNRSKYVTKVIALKADGKLYDENGNEQVIADRGKKGFDAFYIDNTTKGKIIAIDTPDTSKRFADISTMFLNDCTGSMY